MPEANDPNQPSASDDRLRAILNELHEESKDVQVSMVVTRDGLTMAVVGGVVDPDKVGAMCSDLLRLCHSAALELQRGDVEHVLMRRSRRCRSHRPRPDHAGGHGASRCQPRHAVDRHAPRRRLS